ncbi:MAG: FtsX-like permease family protein [Sphaerochaeta sp.]
MIGHIAWRYAFSKTNKNRGVSLRIAAGLAIAILAILVTLSIMQALQGAQFDLIRRYESYDLSTRIEYSLKEARVLAQELATRPTVKRAFVYEDVNVLLQRSRNESIPFRIRAIDLEGNTDITTISGDLHSHDGIALSFMNRYYGDEVTLTFLRSGKQVTQVPKQQTFRVTGIFATHWGEFDQSTILATPEFVSTLIGSEHVKVGVILNDEKALSSFDNEIFITYKEANQALYQAMELEQKMMGLLLFLLVLVIILHLHTSSKRLVHAKQREIALLRTLGFEERHIIILFVTVGFIVAFIGSIGGLLLTFLFFLIFPIIAPPALMSLGLTLTLRSGEVLLLLALILALSSLGSYRGIKKVVHVDITEILGHDKLL